MLDDMKPITGAQIRLARAILNLSKPQLSKNARIGVTTISRMEGAEMETPDVKWQTLNGLERYLTQELEKIGWHLEPKGGISPMTAEA